jgi:hypothetical protein
MHRPAAIALIALLCFGCALPPSPRRAGYGDDVEYGGSSRISPRQQLEHLDAHLRGLGYAPLGPAVHNRHLHEKGMVSYTVHARPGECFVAVALGAEETDLSLILVDATGRVIGYHVGDDAHPWIEHCPTHGDRYTARLQMGRGSGEYYYAAYGGPSEPRSGLASYFGAQRDDAVQTASLDGATAERLAALDARFGQERYTRTAEPHGVVLSEGEARRYPLNLEAGRCYAFVSLAGPGAQDSDVSVMDGAGNELARDAEDARDGKVQFCAPATGTYQLQTTLHGGRGPVFVAGYIQDTQTAAAPSKDAPLIEERSAAGAGLEENFRLLDADMQARGYQAYGEPTRGRLTEGKRRDFAIELEGGKCYAILGVGDHSVRDLDLILLDPSGNKLDRDFEQDARPIVRVCPERSGNFTMRVQMMRGEGDFVYAPYRWPRGTRGPFGLAGLIYVRLAEVTSLLSAEGYAPNPSYTPEKGRLVRQGDTATHDLSLTGGQCYTLLAVGGEGVSNLDVTLLQGDRRVTTDGTRNAFPSARHCPTQDGRYRLAVTAAQGSGEYFYQVFTRSEE